MSNKHQGGPNPPGYKSPVRNGKRTIGVYLELALFDAMHEIMRRDGKTVQGTLLCLCEEYVRTDGKFPTPRCE